MFRRSVSDCVKVHDKDLVDSFIAEIDGEKACLQLQAKTNKKQRRHCKKTDVRVSSAPDAVQSKSVDSKGILNNSTRVQDWLNEKTIKDLQERADQESQAAKSLYVPFLETESTFVKDVGKFLDHKELVDLRKKEVLHKRWSDQVYEPIRSKILQAIDGMEWCHLDRRKREMHRQFLEHVNKRGQVYLDDDDTQEYYAQALNGHRPAPIKVKTESLNDPLLTQSRQRAEEDRTVMRCMTGQRYTDRDLEQVRLPPLPLVPLGRHGINSCKWLEMPLTNIESTPREKSRRRMYGNCTKGGINFEIWSGAAFDAKVAERELQIPRKRNFAEQPPYGKPAVQIPHVPFIDPEEFSDKIINTNPYQEHMQNVMEEAQAKRMFYEMQQQQFLEEQQMQQPMLMQA